MTKDFLQLIQNRILTEVPAIKVVRPWNNQFRHANDPKLRDEKAMKYPCCYVEFITIEIWNRALRIKDVLLTVRFRFGIESYKFVKLETFGFCDDFDRAIQLMAPSGGLTFTTLQEINREFDEDHNNVEIPYNDYRTLFRYDKAYRSGIEWGPIVLGGTTVLGTLATADSSVKSDSALTVDA
jgi:hypothetical protein